MARYEDSIPNTDMTLYSTTENVIVEVSDSITFWSSIYGKPSESCSLVKFLNDLLAGKQDLIYFIVDHETDKESISKKITGAVVFVKETKKLYIYYAETPEWVLINQDLSVYYDKDEMDALLALKANIIDVYSKIEADERFATIASLTEHINNRNNPHQVTKTQVGLGKVENLTPLEMPISNATQQALNEKQNVITGAISNVTNTDLTPNKVVITNSEGKLATDDGVDVSKLELLEGATGNIQEQLDNKENAFEKNTAFNRNFTTNLSDIKMDGIKSLGVSNQIPRADHVHPSDTSKVNANAPITGGTYTKVSFDSKGLVTGGSNLQPSDIPTLSQYEVKSNKVNELTNSTVEYPTTRAVRNAISSFATVSYVDESIAGFNDELDGKENAFSKNTAFNKNFATDKQEFQMDGEAFAGTSNNVPRADHVHPTDTTREAVANKTDYYDTSSPITYASSRALYNGLNTRLKPTNVIGGNRINVVVDGDKIILNAYGGTTTVEWGGITGDINNQADLIQILDSKIGLDSLSSDATGLLYNNTTGVFSLDEDYVIPTSTQLANLQRNFTFEEKGITKTTSSYSTIDLAKEIAALQLPMSTTLFGEVRLNDMPTGIGNAEMKVEVQQRTGSSSVLAFTLTSTNVEPHEWEFYWVGTSSSGSPSTTSWYATVRENMVLTKTNTTAYTPTGDYNPATKKYVDEIIPDQTGNADKFLTTNGTTVSWSNVPAPVIWRTY